MALWEPSGPSGSLLKASKSNLGAFGCLLGASGGLLGASKAERINKKLV